MKACFTAGSKQGSLTTAAERAGDPDVRNSSMYSRIANGGWRGRAILWCATNTMKLSFVLVRAHDGKLASARRDGENYEPSDS